MLLKLMFLCRVSHTRALQMAQQYAWVTFEGGPRFSLDMPEASDPFQMAEEQNGHPSLGLQWPLRPGLEVIAASHHHGGVLWSVR